MDESLKYLFVPDQDTLGAESLLKKYIYQLCCHASEVLPAACDIAAGGGKHFAAVIAVLRTDVICKSFETSSCPYMISFLNNIFNNFF